MSTISTLYFRDQKEDIAIIATDSLSISNCPTEKNGIILPETLCSITSKTQYIPHLKTVISTFGATLVRHRLREFIELKYAISSLEQLIYYIEMDFCKSMLSDNRATDLVIDHDNPDFLGMIFLTGYSDEIVYRDKGLIGKREKPFLLSYKLIVYKDHIVNCGTVNNDSESYNGGYMYCIHPQLSEKVISPLLDKLDINIGLQGTVRSPSYTFMGDVFLEVHRNYNNSGRKTIVGGGEIHITSLTIARDDPKKPMIVSQFTLFQFPDFEEARKEIVQFHANNQNNNK